jgi:hypothetical protein
MMFVTNKLSYLLSEYNTTHFIDYTSFHNINESDRSLDKNKINLKIEYSD